MSKPNTDYVIWDPAPNLVVGQGEDWSEKDAERFLAENRDQFSQSAHVTKDVWPLLKRIDSSGGAS